MRLFGYLLLNGIFITALYFGFIVGVTGALNIAVFMGWFVAILSWAYLSDEVINTLAEKGVLVPKELDFLLDLGITLTFVYFGHFVLSFFYLAGAILQFGAKGKAEEKIKELNENSN